MARISASVGSYESGAVNKKDDVKTVQELLNTASRTLTNPSFHAGTVDGLIARVGSNSATVRAIRAFQRYHVGMRRPDDRIDVGGTTWRHLVQATQGGVVPAGPATPSTEANADGFATALARIAEGEVGITEGARNNTGEDIQKYKEATWLAPGAWPWCAAFVCWCMQQALGQHPITGLRRPQTAAAWGFEDWADKEAKAVLHKPAGTVQKGDIVCFTFSHIGIAIADEAGGSVQTVEGNTNVAGERDGGGRTIDGVYRKTRAKSLIRSNIRIRP